jgi:hypothetical protein
MKRVTSHLSQEVWLTVSDFEWLRLDNTIKVKFLLSLENIAHVRQQIADSAKVQSMPPVEVICELWSIPENDTSIDVRIAPLPSERGHKVFGVQLPAQTATLADVVLLRKILVDEFAQCFWCIERVIEQLAAGKTSLSFSDFNPNDDTENRKRVVDAPLWFGEDDARELVLGQHNAAALLHANFVELSTLLPVCSPPIDYKLEGIAIPVDILQHVARMRDG